MNLLGEASVADARKNLTSGITEAKQISVAIETNGRGFIGFIVQLPGAYVRGATEEEALSKVGGEVQSYAEWLGVKLPVRYQVIVSQRHSCALTVEDADSEILLDEDITPLGDREFVELRDLVSYSAETFHTLFTGADLKDWVDEGRIRKTFYGDAPKTIRETFDHVNGTQYYYLSRVNITPRERGGDFLQVRQNALNSLREMHELQRGPRAFRADGEDWTLTKIMRRFVWHDRIHGKAIARIMRKQERLGLIAGFEDPFHFRLD